MLYLDYAKQTEDGYIMNFFANSVEDLEDISEGKEFVTKNGTNYGVPAPQSVVTITNKDGEKTTYLMGEDGNWIPGVVNPTDYYTKKQVDAKLEGKEDKITDINLTETGTTVTYDTTDGITLNSTARLTSNEETHDATMKLELPIVPGTGISIDKKENSEKVGISIDGNTTVKLGGVQMYTEVGATGSYMQPGNISVAGTPGSITIRDIRDNYYTVIKGYTDDQEGNYLDSNVTVSLPNKNGTLATTDDVSTLIAGRHDVLQTIRLDLVGFGSKIVTYEKTEGSPLLTAYAGTTDNSSNYSILTPRQSGNMFCYLPAEGGRIIARAGTINDGRLVIGNGGDSVRGSNLRPEDLMTTGNVKTLFGNQSIVGTGNIDLYKHNVSLFIPDNISLSCNIYSSSNTEINTKELLITLAGLSNPPKFGDSLTIAAYGWYKKENDVYAQITHISNDYTMGLRIETFSGFSKDGTGSSIEFPDETITDTVTAI